MKYFAEMIEPKVRYGTDTSSSNILDILDYIKRTDPEVRLTLSDGRGANHDNVLKELKEPLTSTILYHGQNRWIVTSM
jgi:hypothetical protein